jgi:hypothetical protein
LGYPSVLRIVRFALKFGGRTPDEQS